MKRVPCSALLVSLAGALALTGAAGAGRTAQPLSIYAAASLTEAFRSYDASQNYSFGGSNQLAFQIRQGAPADLFASAAPSFTQDLYRQGLVEKPVTFATNRLVLAVPRSNPEGIRSVYDLRRPGIKLVVATAAVPVGSYTRTVLRNLGLLGVLANVVSQESDVKGVVGKVALGQADAGFVYQTDVRPVADQVTPVKIPSWAQPRVRYEIAVVTASRNTNAAQAWIRRLTSPAGKKALAGAGFGTRY